MNPQNVYKKILINARQDSSHPHSKSVVTDKAAGSRPCPKRSGGPRGRGRGRSWGRAAGLQQQTFSCAHKTELRFLLLSDHFIRLQHFGGRMFTRTEVRLLSIISFLYFLQWRSISAEITRAKLCLFIRFKFRFKAIET